jgi:WD40 repeat protein
VLYSRGYRLDFQNKNLVETGGIYVRSKPADTMIFLDGKQIKSDTGVFNSGTLITDLPSGTYKIELVKDSYHSWAKNALVEPSVVSVFDTIVLVPNNGKEKIAESTDKFYIHNDKMIFEKDNTLLYDNKTIIGNRISAFTDSGSVVSYDIERDQYYLSNIFDLESSLNLNTIFNNLKEAQLNLPGIVPITKIEPYQYNDRKFIIKSRRALYSVDTERLEIKQISPEAKDFVINGNNVLWINDKGIFSYNVVFRNAAQIFTVGAGTSEETIAFSQSQSQEFLAFLKSDGKLTLIDGDEIPKIIAEDAVSFYFSPDNEILIYISKDNSIFAYFLTDNEKISLISSPSALDETSISWHNSNRYFFIKDADKNLRFIEVDNLSPINETVIAPSVKHFFYSQEDSALYFDNGDGIWKLKI